MMQSSRSREHAVDLKLGTTRTIVRATHIAHKIQLNLYVRTRAYGFRADIVMPHGD
jgi:hypothetical protein